MKNTKPITMTDKGPYGTTRAKSEDGQYTANPNYQAERSEQASSSSPTSPFEANKKSFSEIDTSFDEKISQPTFDKFINAFASTFEADLEPGHKTVSTQSNEYEDKVLNIDYFIGNASPDHEYLIDETEVNRVDLKTIKSGLGNREFFEHPKLTITMYKMHKRHNGEISKKEFEQGMNTHLAFQVLYSSKPPRELTSIDDIEAAKYYYIEKPALASYLKRTASIVDQATDIYRRRDISTYEIKNQLETLFKRRVKEIRTYKGETRWIISFPENGTEILLNEEQSGDRQVRYAFPTKAINQDKELMLGTQKMMLDFRKR